MVVSISGAKNANLIDLYTKNKNMPVQDKNQATNSVELPSKVTQDFSVKLPQPYIKLGVDKLENGQEIHSYKLFNGQKVIIAPMEAPYTCINTYVNTGAMDETPENRGISHFLEHMLFNGTKGTDNYTKLNCKHDVKNIIDSMGGESNARTSYTNTQYEIKIPQFETKDLEKAIQIQSSMINNPELSKEQVEKEKEIIKSEFNLYYNDAMNIGLDTASKNICGIKEETKDYLIGSTKDIDNITQEKLIDYHAKNYTPDRMTTVITGNVDVDESIKLVANNFHSKLQNKETKKYDDIKPIEQNKRVDLISEQADNTKGVIIFNGVNVKDLKEKLALDIVIELAKIQDSDINNEITNNTNEFYFDEQILNSNDGKKKHVVLKYSTDEQKSEKTLKKIFAWLNNQKNINPKDLKTVKNSLKLDYLYNIEDPNFLNTFLENKGNIPQKNNSYTNIIDEITTEDLHNTMNKYLNPEKSSIAIIHPKNTTIEELKKNYMSATNTNIAKSKNINFGRSFNMALDTTKISTTTLNNGYEIGFYDEPESKRSSINVTFTPTQKVDAKPGTQKIARALLDNYISNGANCLGLARNQQFTAVGTNDSIAIEGSALNENLEDLLTLVKVSSPFSIGEKSIKAMFGNARNEVIYDKVKKTDASSYDAFWDKISNDNATEQEINNITPEDVINYFNDIKKSCKATVSVVGPTDKIKNTITESFSFMDKVNINDKKYINMYQENPLQEVITKTSSDSQANISMGYKFKSNGNVKDDITFKLLENILSHGKTNGLKNNIRENGKLSYLVDSIGESVDDLRTLACVAATTTDNLETGEKNYKNVEKIIKGFHGQINNLKNGMVTDEELNMSKKGLKQEILESSFRQRGKVISLSDCLSSPYGVKYQNLKLDTIDTITKQDITNAANYVFNNKPIYSIVATKNTLDANKQFLDSLNNK